MGTGRGRGRGRAFRWNRERERSSTKGYDEAEEPDSSTTLGVHPRSLLDRSVSKRGRFECPPFPLLALLHPFHPSFRFSLNENRRFSRSRFGKRFVFIFGYSFAFNFFDLDTSFVSFRDFGNLFGRTSVD